MKKNNEIINDFKTIFKTNAKSEQEYYAFSKQGVGITISEKLYNLIKNDFCGNDDVIDEMENALSRYRNVTFRSSVNSLDKCPPIIIDKPLVVELQATSKCNMFCKHCYNSSGEHVVFLKIEKIYEIIDYMVNEKIANLILTGGEAILYPDIFSIISYASKRNIDTSLNSNGYLLVEKTVEKLKAAGLKKVNISIDGNKEIHDYLRNKANAFDRALNAIKLAQKCGLETEIFCTCMEMNYPFLPDVVNLAKSTNTHLYFIRHHGSGRSKFGRINGISKGQIEKLDELYCCDKLVSFDKCFHELAKGGSCITINSSILSVQPNGDVRLCPYLLANANLVGNIYSDTIYEIMDRRIDFLALLKRKIGNGLTDTSENRCIGEELMAKKDE